MHMMVRWGACEPQCACGVGSLLPPSCKSQRSHEVRLAVRAPFLAEPRLLLSPEVLRLSPHTYIKALCTDDTVTGDQELLDYRIMSTGENPRPETRPWAVTPPPSMHRLLQSQFTGEKDISAPCPSLTQLTHYPWMVYLLEEVLVITVTIYILKVADAAPAGALPSAVSRIGMRLSTASCSVWCVLCAASCLSHSPRLCEGLYLL